MGIGFMMSWIIGSLSYKPSLAIKYHINIDMYAYIGIFMLIIGAILYIIAKVRIWWNHE